MGIPLITNSGVGDVEKTSLTGTIPGIVIREFNEQEFEAATVQTAAGKIFDRAGIRTGPSTLFTG
ncbi:MAG: hypothetical protein IPL50_12160 [Chitinophagaceae bacterium]|nr:hypothetical protein [Chitinophagaceae bacterium]